MPRVRTTEGPGWRLQITNQVQIPFTLRPRCNDTGPKGWIYEPEFRADNCVERNPKWKRRGRTVEAREEICAKTIYKKAIKTGIFRQSEKTDWSRWGWKAGQGPDWDRATEALRNTTWWKQQLSWNERSMGRTACFPLLQCSVSFKFSLSVTASILGSKS